MSDKQMFEFDQARDAKIVFLGGESFSIRGDCYQIAKENRVSPYWGWKIGIYEHGEISESFTSEQLRLRPCDSFRSAAVQMTKYLGRFKERVKTVIHSHRGEHD